MFTLLLLFTSAITFASAKMEPLKLSTLKGKAPLTVTIEGPPELIKRIADCKYSVGWNGPSGNGLTIQWIPGEVEPKFGAGKDQGASCASVKTHTFQKAGKHKVEARLWHPGPNDAPVTEWSGSAEVEATL